MKLFVGLFATSLFLKTNTFKLNTNKCVREFSKKISMRKELGDSRNMFPIYQPKTENQKKYAKYLSDPKTKVIFAFGPAGTGKTLFASNQAINDLKQGTINKIILTRPVVPVEEDIGFLPGNINKKMDPWTRPIFDIFSEFYAQRDIDLMLQNGVIEISPLAYMRGRTFKKAFIIADEMQNSSPNQMLMLTTRLGVGSKMVITGDLKQSDKGINSGLHDFIHKFRNYEQLFYKIQESSATYNRAFSEDDHSIGIKLLELGLEDVERSPIVSRILDIYDEEKTRIMLDDILKKEWAENDAKTRTYEETKKNMSETNTTITKQFPLSYANDAALIPLGHKNVLDKYLNF